jgi:hypothetical protein
MRCFYLTSLASHLVDGLGQSLDVRRRDSSDGNAAVFRSVNGVLVGSLLAGYAGLKTWQVSSLPPWRAGPSAQASALCKRTCRSAMHVSQ